MSDHARQIVRVAAVGDLHIRTTAPRSLEEELIALKGQVDLMIVAGDITESGRIIEVEAAAEVLSVVDVPMVGVLGNHDRRGLRRSMMRKTLETAGLELLDGSSMVVDLPDGRRMGLAGVSGTGGGFWFDESEVVIGGRIRQVAAVKARREALRLKAALDELRREDPDVTVAVTHFAPTMTTLGEEPVLKHWMLGNSLLGKVIDNDGYVDLAIHGHAHLGNSIGATVAGVPVRNVAMQVTGGVMVFEVGSGQQVQSVRDLPGPSDDRDSETRRFRMTDLLHNVE